MSRKAGSNFNVIEGSYDIDAVNERGKSTEYTNGMLEKLDTSRTSNLHSETSLKQESVRNEDADMFIDSSNSLQGKTFGERGHLSSFNTALIYLNSPKLALTFECTRTVSNFPLLLHQVSIKDCCHSISVIVDAILDFTSANWFSFFMS